MIPMANIFDAYYRMFYFALSVCIGRPLSRCFAARKPVRVMGAGPVRMKRKKFAKAPTAAV